MLGCEMYIEIMFFGIDIFRIDDTDRRDWCKIAVQQNYKIKIRYCKF